MNKQKLLTALAAASAPVLVLFFFGPAQVYLPNSGSFHFMMDKLLLRFFPVALALFLVTAAFLRLLPEKYSLHHRFTVLAVAVSVLLWLQGNVLLWDYGVLDGSPIQWGKLHLRGIIDGLIWLTVLTVAIIKAKQIYKYAAKIALFVILLQALYIGILLFQSPAAFKVKNFLMLDDSRQFGFSSKRNVIVMILDGFQSDLFQEIVHQDPSYGEIFDGFTYQRNALGGFPLTQPSIPFILTGERFDNSMRFHHFIQEVYFSESSLPFVLKENDFRVDILMDCGRCIVKDKRLLSNLKEKVIPLSNSRAGYVFDLTLFKHLPHFLKRMVYNNQQWRFVNYLRGTDKPEFDDLAEKINPVSGRPFQKEALEQLFDVRFAAGMIGESEIITDKDTFKFYHLKGAHVPFRMTEKLELSDMKIRRGNWIRQAKGSLKIAELFLDELKRLGIYDNSMIFIIADHGHSGGLFGIRKPRGLTVPPGPPVPANERIPEGKIASALPLMLVKPFNQRGTLKISDNPVSLSDIPHTVFSALGINGEFPGRNILTLNPEEPRTRRFSYFEYKQGKAGGDGTFPRMNHYRITGHSWLVESWRPAR